jgi:hypothetical protein
MSEESLRRFLERAATDTAFREGLTTNLVGALSEFGLSATERVAIVSGDEDSLRRLSGEDIQGYMLTGQGGLVGASDWPGSCIGCRTSGPGTPDTCQALCQNSVLNTCQVGRLLP